MNRPADLPRVFAAVDLAQVADFLLGGLEIRPSLRQVRAAGREETIQPRIMQVLIALRRANGAVVSREALIESCWDGIVVGDDAINRCIVKLRQISEFGGTRHFEVETVPRVGYRLRPIVASPASATQEAREPLPADFGTKVETTAASGRSAPWKRLAIGISASIVVIAGLFAASGFFRATAPARWVVVRSEVPIANGLIARHPAISPDGTMIAWSAGNDVFSRHIYLKRIAGGDPLQVTADSYDDASPSWSPDGSEIVYVAYRQGQPCHLMAVPALAGSARELGRCQNDERSQVVWSPRGKAVFFTDRRTRGGPGVIMQLDLETGNRVQLTRPPEGAEDNSLAASPDGRWLSFLRELSLLVAPRILLDLDQRKERVLVPNDWELGAAWSEDSETLFDVEADRGAYSIEAYPLDGGKPQQVFSSSTWMERLSSGPNGLLAAEVSGLQTGIARPPEADGGNPRFLETEHGQAFTPDARGDGSVVASISGPDGAALWIFSKKSGARKLLTIDRGTAELAEPRWSHDGSKIAWIYVTDDAMGLRVVTAAGAPVAKISFRGKWINAPAWTADDDALIFPGADDHGWRLWRAQINHPQDVVPLAQRGWTFIKSRGNNLYGVRAGVPGIWQIDGIPRRLFTGRLTEENQWAVAGDSILYFDRISQAIVSVPIDGGPSSPLVHVPSYIRSSGFTVDPTDNSVVYVAHIGTDRGDIELLHLARQ